MPIIVVLLLLAGAAAADQSGEAIPLDRSARPPAGPAPEASFPDFAQHELENGLVIYAIESQRQPTVTYRLMFRSGSLFDGEKAGTASMVAGMLDRGVKGKSAFEIASEIDFIGGSLRAEASSDFLTVTVAGLSKYSDELLDLLAEVVLKPTFPGEELDRLKQRTLSGLAQERKDPAAMADKLRRKLVYGEGNYGQYETEESVASIGREDLLAYYRAHFLPNNASIAVVGDMSEEAARDAIAKRFGQWEDAELASLEPYDYPEIDRLEVHIVDRPESVQSEIRVAQQSVKRSHPDLTELRVVLSVLGGGFSGRMFQNLREDKGYTYGASTYPANAARFGAIVTTTSARNEVTGGAVKEILNELKRIREKPIPEPELSMHRRYLAGNYMLSLESPLSTAQRVQEIDVYGLDEDHYRRYVEELLSVDSELAQELAREHLTASQCVVAVVGKAKEVAPTLSELGPVTLYDEDLKVKADGLPAGEAE